MIYRIEDSYERIIDVFRYHPRAYCVMVNHKHQASYRTFKEAVEHARRLASKQCGGVVHLWDAKPYLEWSSFVTNQLSR